MPSFPRSILKALEYLKLNLSSNATLVLFGGRARASHHQNADFDIGLWEPQGVDWRKFCVLKTRAEELAWPFRLDLVSLNRAPADFVDAIGDHLICIQGNWEDVRYGNKES